MCYCGQDGIFERIKAAIQPLRPDRVVFAVGRKVTGDIHVPAGVVRPCLVSFPWCVYGCVAGVHACGFAGGDVMVESVRVCRLRARRPTHLRR